MTAKFDVIAGYLRELIQSGELRTGEQLPTVQSLMRTHKVARQTAQRALETLSDEGLIHTHKGRRAVVADPTPMRVVEHDRYDRHNRVKPDGSVTFQRQVAQSGWSGEVIYIEVGHAECPESVTKAARASIRGNLAMGLAPGDRVVIRRRLQRAAPHNLAGEPDEVLRRAVQLHTSWIPEWVAKRVPAVLNAGGCGPGGSFSRIEEAGLIIEEFDREIYYRATSNKETELLGLTNPTMAVIEQQVVLAEGGIPVTVDRFVGLPTKVRFKFRIPHRD